MAIAGSKIVLWTLLIPVVVSQLPMYSTSTSSYTTGNCADPESQPSLLELGGRFLPTTDGLISQQLLVTAQDDYSPGNDYYTMELPEVLILSSRITCKSDSPFRNDTFGSIALLVSYSCRGVACRQRSSEVQTLTYLHQFAFVCDASMDSFTTYGQIGGYSTVDRSTSNNIVDTTIADAGSCRRCGITLLDFPDHDPVTGCFSMLISHFGVLHRMTPID